MVKHSFRYSSWRPTIAQQKHNTINTVLCPADRAGHDTIVDTSMAKSLQDLLAKNVPKTCIWCIRQEYDSILAWWSECSLPSPFDWKVSPLPNLNRHYRVPRTSLSAAPALWGVWHRLNKVYVGVSRGKKTLSEIQSYLLSLLLKPQFDPAPTQWKQPQGHQSRSTKSVINYWDRLSVLTVRTQLRYIPIQHLIRLIPWHCFRFCTAS